jgi:hypothetical protein
LGRPQQERLTFGEHEARLRLVAEGFALWGATFFEKGGVEISV